MIDVQDISVLDLVNSNYETIQVVDNNYDIKNSYIAYYEVKNPKKPTIIDPQTTEISSVVNLCVNKLKNGSPEEQQKYLSLLMKGLENPKIAPQFLDTKILDSLFYIINKDTSSLKKTTKKQKKLRKKLENGEKLSKKDIERAYSLSEQEIADRNKIYAFVVIAKNQNVLYTELRKRSNLKPNFSDMPASARLLELLNNPDDDIRASAIGALYMMYRPEFKKDLIPVFENASKSQSPAVRDFAVKSLSEINNKK